MRILALQTGTIDMDTSFFDPVHLTQLDEEPDIDIFEAYRNGYGHITINCAKYPLNISGLRRAFAFAFDKTRVTAEVMDGFSIEHDSLVPQPNGWCVEEKFDWHYYTAQPEIGNQILDNLNFTIDTESGFRLAPDGTPFDIVIEYPGTGISWMIPPICVDALSSLHINASQRVADFNEYISRLDQHGDYDMVFYAVNFYSNDVDWLAYEYWSEYVDELYQNPSNFANATYDSWREQLLYGISYEEVYEASVEMQKILQYNVPRLVIYENKYMQAYRTDKFAGQVEDLNRYITGQWTMRKIHRNDATFGGNVSIAISESPETFNIFMSTSPSREIIWENLWPSLYRHAPDATPWSDLAENLLTETHSDNLAVPEGYTRFTIDIIQNATWSDGVPLTANDVAFTFIFLTSIYGHPAATYLEDFVAAYSPTPYRCVIEFSTETYWHFSRFAYQYIIPEHIFTDDGGIGYENWNTWNPVVNQTDPHVTCGPYIVTDYEGEEFCELTWNPQFYYAPDRTVTSSTTTSTDTSTSSSTTTGSLTTTTSTTTEESQTQYLTWSIIVSTVIISSSTCVILICTALIIKTRGER